MSITNKIKKVLSNQSLYKKLYGVELEEVRKESSDYVEREKKLNYIFKNEMEKPSVTIKEINMSVDSWQEYTIQHIYSDMQVLKKAFLKIRSLPNIKDIQLKSDSSMYDLIMEKGEASISVYNYEINLTAWNLSEEESMKVLNLCIDEIIKVQNNMNDL